MTSSRRTRRRGSAELELATWGRFSAPTRELDALRKETKPIAGRDGWRIDAQGHQWYSAEWLGLIE